MWLKTSQAREIFSISGLPDVELKAVGPGEACLVDGLEGITLDAQAGGHREVAGGLGRYGGNFKFKFAAENTGLAVDKSTTLPLPVSTARSSTWTSWSALPPR